MPMDLYDFEPVRYIQVVNVFSDTPVEQVLVSLMLDPSVSSLFESSEEKQSFVEEFTRKVELMKSVLETMRYQLVQSMGFKIPIGAHRWFLVQVYRNRRRVLQPI